MVGIVLVSHSRALAHAVLELVRAMTGPGLPLAAAAGAGENHAELGTDAVEISEAIATVNQGDGVLVLMDMGSAILSAETALDLMDDAAKAQVKFCAAPFVEGAVAAGVTANLGSSLEEVHAEAIAALRQKETALGHGAAPAIAPTVESNSGASAVSERIRVLVPNPHGLHARPAAKLIAAARPFDARIELRNATNQRGPASIKSLSGLAMLEILQGHEIELSACGRDAKPALQKLASLIETGLGDDLTVAPKAVGKRPVQAVKTSGPIPISAGIVVGCASYAAAVNIELPTAPASDIEAELRRLREAVTQAQRAIETHRETGVRAAAEESAAIAEAHVLALQDPELVDLAEGFVRSEQLNAAQGWDRAVRKITKQYHALEDEYLRERAADVEDIGRQVLELLVGRQSAAPKLDRPGILIADNLTPYDVTALDPKMVRGVILLDGGATAHSSILLRSLGIPSIAQARGALAGIDLQQPVQIAFDGATGRLWLNPDPKLAEELETRQAEERKRGEEERKASRLPATTRDGLTVEILGNVGDVAGTEAAVAAGAEGIGLLRTEFLFLDRATPPSEDEQYGAIRAIGDRLQGRPLIVRTLDAGGDKELPYLAMAPEENPFLGVRALRLCLAHEDLFNTQLRAILRAGVGRDLRIMFPMIASVADLDRALLQLETVHHVLEAANVPHLWPVQTGIMIEIPSAALLAGELAERAQFFSIGTNDLTQYTLAADRGNPALSEYQDALHPAVLRLIAQVVEGAKRRNRLVAVCGEAASDEVAAAIFVGLGVRELSLSPARIPRLKASLRERSLSCLQLLATSALACRSAGEVRALK
jgi:phosphocarrier protein FPr